MTFVQEFYKYKVRESSLFSFGLSSVSDKDYLIFSLHWHCVAIVTCHLFVRLFVPYVR
jgi:hypothetical protein